MIIEDGGEVLPEGEKDNTRATKYQKRTGDIRNLEASNRLFAKLVEEMHTRGMRVILDGVFNHCGSFNKWMDRERIYEAVWGLDGEGNSDTIMEHIRKIRNKFAALSRHSYIETVWGVGYKWNG